MEKNNIIKRLIHSYPDAIVVNDFNIVDADETVCNFAERFKDDFDDGYEKSTFGIVFDNADEMSKYILTNLLDLIPECQRFVDENDNKFND